MKQNLSKLQADANGIKSELQAGRQADRQKVMSLMTDIHTIVDNGMFSKEDQTDLATEFDSLKNH